MHKEGKMNKDEILAMPAGREIDALIAVQVLEWKVDDITAYSPNGGAWARNVHGDNDWLEYFSTDMTAAWKVIERLYKLGFNTRIEAQGKIRVTIWSKHMTEYGPEPVSAIADIAALAVCRAALLCVSSI